KDREIVDKSSTLPHHLAPRVTSPSAVEGMEINQLKERVKQLEEREGVTTINSRDDAPIKGRSMDEGEAATERIDAQVTRELEEQLEKEDQRRAEKIARYSEIARIHAEKELQSMIDGLDSNNETVAKYLEEYHQFSSELSLESRIELISDLVKYQDNYTMIYKFQSQQRKSWTKKQKRDYYMAVIRNNLGWKVKDSRGMTFEEVEAKFNSVCKQMEDFIPIEEIIEEAKSLKEKVKEMMNLVPIEEVYVEALQVKHPIIDWKVHSEGQRNYWKITRLGGSLACYQFFIDLLKHLDREDLNQLWRLVKE
nr:hypothetical protein [Tanacetum cinerariifolium]